MAIPKKGARKIIVNNHNFKWLIRKKVSYTQSCYGDGKLHVAIELEENPGTSLFVVTDRKHPEDICTEIIKSVIPSDVANWIQQAIALGWNPSEKGKPLQVVIVNEKMELK